MLGGERVDHLSPAVRDHLAELLAAAHRAHWHVADASAAKANGAMVALYPRRDYAQQIAIPTGEPVEDLHLTLVHLGDNISSTASPDTLIQSMSQLADSFTVIDTRVTGTAVIGEGAVVYLVGNNSQLPDLHTDTLNAAHTSFQVPRQFNPWLPHVTVGYDINPRQLNYTGLILFDRIGVAFRGQTHFLPLLGATIGEYSR